MRDFNIALDIEGVCANSHAATWERSDFLNMENCPPHNYDLQSQDHLDEYMHVSQNVWHNHFEDIEEMEQPVGWDLGWATKRLSAFHNVDVLTSRTGVDEQLERWLDLHSVEYDELIVTSNPRSDKTEYGDHDVHIEDSPNVAEDALDAGRMVFLIDRPYNENVRDDADLWRVSSVAAAAHRLSPPRMVRTTDEP